MQTCTWHVENKKKKGCKPCFQETCNASYHFKSSISFLGEIVLHEKYNDFYNNNYIIISILIIFDTCIDVVEYIELYLSESSQ